MAFGSCFIEDGFTRATWRWPEPSPPQAFRLSDELSASFARLIAALRSRSSTSPQSGRAGFSQRNVRSARVRSPSTHPQPEHVLLDGSHRSPTTTRQPYQPPLEVSCRRNAPSPTPPPVF